MVTVNITTNQIRIKLLAEQAGAGKVLLLLWWETSMYFPLCSFINHFYAKVTAVSSKLKLNVNVNDVIGVRSGPGSANTITATFHRKQNLQLWRINDFESFCSSCFSGDGRLMESDSIHISRSQNYFDIIHQKGIGIENII